MYINWNPYEYANRHFLPNWGDPWYGLLKKFKRGERIIAFLTFRCNLDCGYCTLKFTDGKMPESDEMNLEHWQEIVRNQFPRPIKEVTLSGGEPMLVPYFTEFTNWLLEQGLFVSIWSNLMTRKGLEVTPSKRYRICATYHHSSPRKKFLENYKEYSKKFRVDVEEIGTEKWLPMSVLKPYSNLEHSSNCKGFFYAPDGRLYTNFLTIDRQYSKTNQDYIYHSSEGIWRNIRRKNAMAEVLEGGL
jgi:organic radical activating enzyme